MNNIMYSKDYSFLMSSFFVVSFFSLTYKYNFYIIFALMIFMYIMMSKFRVKLGFLIPLFLITLVYYFDSGFGGFYRYLKTLLLIIPLAYVIFTYKIKINKLFLLFINISVLFIYIEFITYQLFGIIIFPNTTNTLGLLRHHAFFEDSNFFSYTILIFILYGNTVYNKYNFYYIGALLISLSVSAVSVFLILVIILYLHRNYFLRYSRFIRISFFVFITIVISLYYFTVINSDKIRNLSDNPFIQFKLVSLSIRFEVQKNAINKLIETDNLLLGLGIGSARKLNDRNLNLHNTYLQVLVEIGLLGLIPILGLFIFIYWNIHILYVPLLSVVFLLGNIMEVFYFPLLLFIFFLSKVYISQKHRSKNEILINNSNIR